MAEDQAPPVVAVVVASDPGPWLEECLDALGSQDYPSLSTLVVDAGSGEPLAARIAAVAPRVFVCRLADNNGFGPSANVVLDTVEGSTFYLFCHDDVVPDNDAVRKMVEEAFRSNAGLVAPKLVAYDEPDRILQLGLGVDRFGAPVRRVARREFDQSQHDEVREVFGAPGGCTLVRSDLFEALNGYDKKISMFGEDVDLSWRARIAGARIVVAPSARVRHCEATSSRQRPLPEARSLQWRHELRAVLKNYGPPRRLSVAIQLAALSVLEICYFSLIGKRWRVRQVVGAWRWNLAPEQELREARRAVAASRRIPDRVVSRLFTRRTLRVTRFVRPMLEELVVHWSHPSRAGRPGRAGRSTVIGALSHASLPSSPGSARSPRRGMSRRAALAVLLAVVVLVFGSRSLLVGHLPLVGQYLPLPKSTTLLARYFGGSTDAGLQRAGPSTPAFAILGTVGLLLGSSMGLVLKLGLVLAVVSGALGVAHLLRPLGPSYARVAGAIAYLFLPLAWNDLSRGNLQALVAFGGMPWLIGGLARATGLPPFDNRGSALFDRSSYALKQLARDSLSLGVPLAVVGSFEPLVVVLTLACASSLVVATALFDRPRAGLRAVSVGVGATVVAFVLAFPWSLTFVQRGARWSVLSGAASRPDAAPRLSHLLDFDLGTVGRGPLAWAFIVAASFVLLVGRGPRFAWAARLWVVALGTLALAWSASEGWLGAGGGELDAFVAPVAVCVAALIGLGVAAASADLRRSGFGWRHLAVVGFGAVSIAGLLPVLGASLGGRWGLAETGYDTLLSWVAATGPDASSQRSLWLGDPGALPSPGWQVSPGLAGAVSTGGLPDASRVWLSADPGAGSAVLDDVVSAESGLTIQLGRLLASSGIRYIIVPSAVAPVLPGSQEADPAPPPQVLLDGLAAQSDLHELPSEGGTVVFENSAWHEEDAAVAASVGSGGTPATLRSLGVALALLAWVACGWLLRRRRRGAQAHEGGGPGHRAHRVGSPRTSSPPAPAGTHPPADLDAEGDGSIALDPTGAAR